MFVMMSVHQCIDVCIGVQMCSFYPTTIFVIPKTVFSDDKNWFANHKNHFATTKEKFARTKNSDLILWRWWPKLPSCTRAVVYSYPSKCIKYVSRVWVLVYSHCSKQLWFDPIQAYLFTHK